MAIFTVGLSNVDESKLSFLIKKENISYLVDVRHPNSKTASWCKPLALKYLIEANEVKYVCLIRTIWDSLPGLNCENISCQRLPLLGWHTVDKTVDKLTKAHDVKNFMLCCSHSDLRDCIIDKVFAKLLKKRGIKIHRFKYYSNGYTLEPPLNKTPKRKYIDRSKITYNSFWHDNELEEWWR